MTISRAALSRMTYNRTTLCSLAFSRATNTSITQNATPQNATPQNGLSRRVKLLYYFAGCHSLCKFQLSVILLSVILPDVMAPQNSPETLPFILHHVLYVSVCVLLLLFLMHVCVRVVVLDYVHGAPVGPL
jgi:hypothetical protein